jgi:hypothetical protein
MPNAILPKYVLTKADYLAIEDPLWLRGIDAPISPKKIYSPQKKPLFHKNLCAKRGAFELMSQNIMSALLLSLKPL